MQLLEKASILPMLGQISFGDAGSSDVPQWVEGTEPVVSSSAMVLIATPSDAQGPISCRIWSGAAAPLWESIVFDGDLALASGQVEMGSVVGAHLISAQIPSGTRRVLVRAYPSEAIAVIDAFVFTP